LIWWRAALGFLCTFMVRSAVAGSLDPSAYKVALLIVALLQGFVAFWLATWPIYASTLAQAIRTGGEGAAAALLWLTLLSSLSAELPVEGGNMLTLTAGLIAALGIALAVAAALYTQHVGADVVLLSQPFGKLRSSAALLRWVRAWSSVGALIPAQRLQAFLDCALGQGGQRTGTLLRHTQDQSTGVVQDFTPAVVWALLSDALAASEDTFPYAPGLHFVAASHHIQAPPDVPKNIKVVPGSVALYALRRLHLANAALNGVALHHRLPLLRLSIQCRRDLDDWNTRGTLLRSAARADAVPLAGGRPALQAAGRARLASANRRSASQSIGGVPPSVRHAFKASLSEALAEDSAAMLALRRVWRMHRQRDAVWHGSEPGALLEECRAFLLHAAKAGQLYRSAIRQHSDSVPALRMLADFLQRTTREAERATRLRDKAEALEAAAVRTAAEHRLNAHDIALLQSMPLGSDAAQDTLVGAAEVELDALPAKTLQVCAASQTACALLQVEERAVLGTSMHSLLHPLLADAVCTPLLLPYLCPNSSELKLLGMSVHETYCSSETRSLAELTAPRLVLRLSKLQCTAGVLLLSSQPAAIRDRRIQAASAIAKALLPGLQTAADNGGGTESRLRDVLTLPHLAKTGALPSGITVSVSHAACDSSAVGRNVPVRLKMWVREAGDGCLLSLQPFHTWTSDRPGASGDAPDSRMHHISLTSEASTNLHSTGSFASMAGTSDSGAASQSGQGSVSGGEAASSASQSTSKRFQQQPSHARGRSRSQSQFLLAQAASPRSDALVGQVSVRSLGERRPQAKLQRAQGGERHRESLHGSGLQNLRDIVSGRAVLSSSLLQLPGAAGGHVEKSIQYLGWCQLLVLLAGMCIVVLGIGASAGEVLVQDTAADSIILASSRIELVAWAAAAFGRLQLLPLGTIAEPISATSSELSWLLASLQQNAEQVGIVDAALRPSADEARELGLADLGERASPGLVWPNMTVTAVANASFLSAPANYIVLDTEPWVQIPAFLGRDTTKSTQSVFELMALVQLQLRSVRSKLLAAEMVQQNLTAQLSMLQNGSAPDLEAAVEEAKAHADLLRSHILPALSHSLASRVLVWEYVWLHGDLLPPGTNRIAAGAFMLCFLVVAWVAVGGTVASMVQAMQAVQLLPESLLNALHLESSTAHLSLERQLGRLRGKATSNSPGTATSANVSTAQQHTFLRSPESRQRAAVDPPPESGTEEAKKSAGRRTCCCAGQNKTLLLRQRCALVACIIVPPTLLAAAVLAVHLIAASANTVALQETSARALLLQVLSTAPVACHWAALAAISGFREAAAQELTDVEDAAFDGMDTLSAGAASPVQGHAQAQFQASQALKASVVSSWLCLKPYKPRQKVALPVHLQL
ncbi:unnamed protein product, partial [Symbiodinium sp. KB8]